MQRFEYNDAWRNGFNVNVEHLVVVQEILHLHHGDITKVLELQHQDP